MTRGTCVFCGATGVNREHVFRSAWRKRWPEWKEGRRRQERGIEARDVREQAFDIVVKRTCAACNAGWMNRLDSVAERWLFRFPETVGNPLASDRHELILWAIKTAMMRGFVDNENPAIPQADYPLVQAGSVPPAWRVLIGRASGPAYLHGNFGPVPLPGDGPLLSGFPLMFQQTSWLIGFGIVVAFKESAGGYASQLADQILAHYSGGLADLTAGGRLGSSAIALHEVPMLFWAPEPRGRRSASAGRQVTPPGV